MRPLLNRALVAWLLCASLVAQAAQTHSPKSGSIPAQKSGAGREILPQQELAISVLNNLFEKQKLFVRFRQSRMKSHKGFLDPLCCDV